jgi:SEC-C motif domain protein
MPSRFCAYAPGLADYLLASWHPSTRPPSLQLDASGPHVTRWLGLRIIAHRAADAAGEVEFVARYRNGGGRAVRMHEVSRFRREAGRWLYVDGEVSRR